MLSPRGIAADLILHAGTTTAVEADDGSLPWDALAALRRRKSR
ncbi:hypothetical protein [Stenotrophomonas sp. LARHCG68]